MKPVDELKPSLQKRQKRRDKRMAEEVIECYRSGRRQKYVNGSKKRISGKNFGETPKREGIKRMHSGGTKYLNDKLGPLKGFLEANTGRPWNKVFSELNKKLDRGTVSGRHVIDHLWDFVNLHVEVKSKKEIYPLKASGWYGRHKIFSYGTRPQYYVHPKTGILHRAPNGRWTLDGVKIY